MKVKEAEKIKLNLIIPTKIRLIYGLIITLVLSGLISLMTGKVFILGLLFLLFTTYIVDAFYKSNSKNLTMKIYNEIDLLLRKSCE